MVRCFKYHKSETALGGQAGSTRAAACGPRKEGNDVKVSLILGCVLTLTNVPTSHAQQLKWGDPNYKPSPDFRKLGLRALCEFSMTHASIQKLEIPS